MKKKILSTIIIAVMVFSLSACKNKKIENLPTESINEIEQKTDENIADKKNFLWKETCKAKDRDGNDLDVIIDINSSQIYIDEAFCEEGITVYSFEKKQVDAPFKEKVLKSEYLSSSDGIPYTVEFLKNSAGEEIGFIIDGKFDTVNPTTMNREQILDTITKELKKFGLLIETSDACLKESFYQDNNGNTTVFYEYSSSQLGNIDVSLSTGSDKTLHIDTTNIVNVTFNGDSISRLYVNVPINIISKNENVSVLSSNALKSCVKGILENQSGKLSLRGGNGFGNSLKVTSLALQYKAVTNNGVYCMIPVLSFGGLFKINAIDGTLLENNIK